MNINKWDGKVPDWELEPIGTEQKEAQESGAEKTPGIVEARIVEIAKEAKVVVPEDPKKKDAEIEKIRAEIIGLSTEEAEAIVNETTSETMRRLNQKKRMDEIKQFEQVDQEPESIRTEELKNEYIIRSAYDFNSLMKVIDKVGDITGSDGYVYKSDYLKDVIGEVFVGRKQLNYVTGTSGLRDKVKTLLEAQQSEMDRRVTEQSKSPEEKMKDKIFESEDLKRLREYQESVKKVEPKEKESRSIFNR